MSGRLIIAGGGPAGMAAAVSAKACGVSEVIVMERHAYAGGVLPQCIHDGFGLELYHKSLTGPEYASRWSKKLNESGADILLNTSVIRLQNKNNWKVTCINPQNGVKVFDSDAVILATGCREKTLGQLRIPGSRPSGIYTAGCVQTMMNIYNYLPGRSAVILGSGDIGLIMARRMTLEGIKVKMVLGQAGTGLARNIIQCVRDFDIPMRYGWTVISVHGYKRLKGITIAPIDEHGVTDIVKKEYIPCDTLVVAAGLIPEAELYQSLTGFTKSPAILKRMEIAGYQGLFICGNAERVHNLADHVTVDGTKAGIEAAKYILNRQNIDCHIPKKILSMININVEQTVQQNVGANMICTICPNSCALTVKFDPFSVSGNKCSKGFKYAEMEINDPRRTVTTVVKIDGAKSSLLSVKTDRPVKKEAIKDVIMAAKYIKVSAPVTAGDIILSNVDKDGAALIATGNAERC